MIAKCFASTTMHEVGDLVLGTKDATRNNYFILVNIDRLLVCSLSLHLLIYLVLHGQPRATNIDCGRTDVDPFKDPCSCQKPCSVVKLSYPYQMDREL